MADEVTNSYQEKYLSIIKRVLDERPKDEYIVSFHADDGARVDWDLSFGRSPVKYLTYATISLRMTTLTEDFTEKEYMWIGNDGGRWECIRKSKNLGTYHYL